MKLFKLAIRNLSRNRRRTSLALLTIAIGIASVICLNGFVEGFLKIMVESQVRSRLGDLQISHKNPDKQILRENNPKIKDLKLVPGIKAISPRFRFMAQASRDDIEMPVAVIGVVPSSENQVCSQANQEIEIGGESLQDSDEHQLLISSDLLESLGFENKSEVVGKELHVVADPNSWANAFKIKGIQKSLFAFDSQGFLIIPLNSAQEIAGEKGGVTEFAVRIADDFGHQEVKRRVIQELGAEFSVKDWREVQPFLNEAVGRSQVVLGAICVVLLFIVAFGIANTMQMNVHERTREIGTLAAVGFSSSQIAILFLLEAFSLGLLGAILGIIFGAITILGFREIGIDLPKLVAIGVKTLRPEWPISAVIPTIVATLTASLLAGIAPALHAARLNPITTLRQT